MTAFLLSEEYRKAQKRERERKYEIRTDKSGGLVCFKIER
jgi:hypothetical protein